MAAEPESPIVNTVVGAILVVLTLAVLGFAFGGY